MINDITGLAHTAMASLAAAIDWRWASAIAIVGLIMCGFGWLSRAHRRWKRGWLSELIAEQLASARRQKQTRQRRLSVSWRDWPTFVQTAILERWDRIVTYLRDSLPRQVRALHLPSFPSFLVIAAAIALFFVVPHPPPLHDMLHANWWRGLTDDLEIANHNIGELIVGAFAGLALVVIALVVFVAESIRDDNDYERKRVLVQISWLWPLGLAAMLIPFGFLWSPTRGFTILLELLVAVFTLAAFGRVIRALLDPDIRAQNRLQLLRVRTRDMISESVRERVGNAILRDQLGSGNRIEALHYTVARSWIENDAQGYVFVDASADGWISDVHLDGLASLADRLDRYAQERLGFALRESGPRPRAAAIGSGLQPPGTQLPVRKAYLLKRYREEIPADSVFYGKQRSVFALPEEFGRDPALLDDIRDTIPHVFRFTKDEPSAVTMRREMQGTKDQLTKSIRENALGAIEELRQTYLQIAEEFLRLLVEHGGGYSAEQAEKERSNVFESWTEVRWLQTDLRELIIIAASTDNTDVLGTIGFLPFAIALRAIQVRDHFLFQQFYQFASLLYYLAMEKDAGSRVRAWMTERCWRWPKEVADFYIAHEIGGKSGAAEQIEQLRGFALYSLRVFQDLLRVMADKRDTVAFAVVLREFRKLYTYFREEHAVDASTAFLRMQIERAENDEQRARIESRLHFEEAQDRAAAELGAGIRDILFALGARLLGQHLATPGDPETKKLLDLVKEALPQELDKLTATYAHTSDWRTSDFWGWDHWDFVADGEAHFIDKHGKLNRFFVARALEMLAVVPPATRTGIRLPVSHELAEMAREGNQSGLGTALAEVEANPEHWPGLTVEARACIPVLRQLLATVVQTDREAAAQHTRDAPLDALKLKEFRDELAQHFIDGGRMRRVLTAKGAVELRLGERPGAAVPSLVINLVDDKGAFIAQEHTSYAGWGRSYGQGMAQGEDEAVFSAIIAGAGAQHVVTQGAVVDSIRSALSESRLRDPIIFQSLGFAEENAEFRLHKAFTAKHMLKVATDWTQYNGFMGVLADNNQQIPVFEAFVHRPESQSKVVILDTRKFVRWRQFAPDETPEQRDDVTDLLLVRVSDLNADATRRNEITAQNPPWLAQEGDATEYLRRRVLVTVEEKFKIEILDGKAAVCLSLPTEDETEGSES